MEQCLCACGGSTLYCERPSQPPSPLRNPVLHSMSQKLEADDLATALPLRLEQLKRTNSPPRRLSPDQLYQMALTPALSGYVGPRTLTPTPPSPFETAITSTDNSDEEPLRTSPRPSNTSPTSMSDNDVMAKASLSSGLEPRSFLTEDFQRTFKPILEERQPMNHPIWRRSYRISKRRATTTSYRGHTQKHTTKKRANSNSPTILPYGSDHSCKPAAHGLKRKGVAEEDHTVALSETAAVRRCGLKRKASHHHCGNDERLYASDWPVLGSTTKWENPSSTVLREGGLCKGKAKKGRSHILQPSHPTKVQQSACGTKKRKANQLEKAFPCSNQTERVDSSNY